MDAMNVRIVLRILSVSLTMNILIKQLLPSRLREAVSHEPKVKFGSAYITWSEFTVLQLPRTYPGLDYHPFKLCFSLLILNVIQIPKVPSLTRIPFVVTRSTPTRRGFLASRE